MIHQETSMYNGSVFKKNKTTQVLRILALAVRKGG